MQLNGNLEARVRDLIVREMLQGEESADLTSTTELVETGIVDSINVLKLVDFVEETCSIELEPEDIRQFTTIAGIVRVVESKAGQQA
ncbi:MAG: acyl carrier protein [Candidatus Eiseniibacteriota bacterium]